MNKRPLPARLLASLLLIAVMLLGAASLSAQESGGTWSIQTAGPQGPDSRGRFVWELDPGASLTDYVYIRNLGDQPLNLDIYASDAITTDSGGFDLLPADTPPADVGAWVRVETGTVTVESQQGAVVPFTLTVPDNATPGDHAGGIVASLTRINEDGDENQVRVDYRVGLRIYLQVTGELVPGLVIEDVELSHSGAALYPASGGQAEVSYSLRNTGNVRLSAVERVWISGPLGITLASLQGEEVAEVLPGQSLRRVAGLGGVPPLFNLKAHVTLEPRLPDGAPVGGLVSLSGSAATWSLPVAQALLLAVMIALVGLLLRLRRRRRAELALAQAFSAAALVDLISMLNREHAGDILSLGRRHSNSKGIGSALISSFDRDGLDLVTVADGAASIVRLDWPRRLRSPGEAAAVIRALAREAESAELQGAGR